MTGRTMVAMLALITLGMGCHTPVAVPARPGPSTPVWPKPPAPPRVAYCQYAGEPSDFGIRVAFWRRTVDWIFGRSSNRRFVRPSGVCLDGDHCLCVADPGAGKVHLFDLSNGVWKVWDRFDKTRFVSPVAVAKRANEIYVADSILGKVVAMDLEGHVRFVIEQDLKRPVAVAVYGETLLVADSAINVIRVYDRAGRLLRSFGTRGAGGGQFNFPTHLAVDKTGTVFVTDSMNTRIQMLDLYGHFLGQIGSRGDTSGHFTRPKGLAVDDQGHIYVVDALFDNIQIFDREGRFLLDFGSSGQGPGEFWLPAGMAIGAGNQIVVADSYNRRIQIFKYLGDH